MTTPFSPAQRAAILAEHPSATEADLDRYEALVASRFAFEPDPEVGYGATGGPGLGGTPVDHELAELQRTRFPRITEALTSVEEPPVG
jgi:hypothetical protein